MPAWNGTLNAITYTPLAPSTTGFHRGHRSIDDVSCIDLVSSVQEGKSTKDLTIDVLLDGKGAFDNGLHDAIFRGMTSIGVAGRSMLRSLRTFKRG